MAKKPEHNLRNYSFYGYSNFISDLAKKTGFRKDDVKIVFKALIELIEENFDEAVDMEIGSIHLINRLSRMPNSSNLITVKDASEITPSRNISLTIGGASKNRWRKTNIDKIQSEKIKGDAAIGNK